MSDDDKTPKFTAEMLMKAMGKHSKIKDWDEYAEAINHEAITQGCDSIDPAQLPRRIGQVVKMAAPLKPLPIPSDLGQPPPKKTIKDIAAELGWK